MPSEELRPQADRLASLLADARGAEILAELQRLSAYLRDAALPAGPGPEAGDTSDDAADASLAADGAEVGIWRTEREEGGVALRRRDTEGINPWHWANVAYVPPAGGRRVVLIGESVARGWAYDPTINPAAALTRHLEQAEPGAYQCVDLAQAGATAEDLTRLVGQLPALQPDTVVIFAGNNWGCFPESPRVTLYDDLVEAIRGGGYAAMREVFISTVFLPRARRLTESLLSLHERHGTRIIVVVPEFNLRGWAPPRGIGAPVLATEAFASWHKLAEQAATASQEKRWSDVVPAAEEMRRLDGGTSPVPGQLLGQAGIALGDGALAREGLEASRDSLAGLGIAYTPRVTSEIRGLLTAFAAENGFPCLDMGALLASADIPELPDPRCFFDYCHMSDEGIERVMSGVADAILGLPAGTTKPGPGADPTFSAFMQIIAAAQGAFLGQPPEAVALHLRLAVEADPQVTTVMGWLLDVLEGTGPVWARAAVEPLASMRPGSALFGHVLLSNNLPPELWTLRACLGAVLGTTPADAPAEADLIAAPFSDGLKPPNLAPGRGFYQATAETSTFAFALSGPSESHLDVTYRMIDPGGSPALVTLNGRAVGSVPSSRKWAPARIVLPADATCAGVNWLSIRWPVPVLDGEARLAADLAAMGRGEFPYVLPVFGELFDARVRLARADS